MATGDEARVYQALLDHIEVFNNLEGNGYRVAIPNKDFEPTTYPYLDIQDFRADRNAPTLGRLKQVAGVFQVTIVERRNKGLLAVKEIVSRLIAHCPNGHRIYDGDLCVTIKGQANERPPIYEATEVRVPVTIPYYSLV